MPKRSTSPDLAAGRKTVAVDNDDNDEKSEKDEKHEKHAKIDEHVRRQTAAHSKGQHMLDVPSDVVAKVKAAIHDR
jgi:hypothetical protein